MYLDIATGGRRAHRRAFTDDLVAQLLLAAGLTAAVATPTWATPLQERVKSASASSTIELPSTEATDPESAARHNWRKYMGQNGRLEEGCFHASYPNTVWEKVDCVVVQPRVHTAHVKPSGDHVETVGNGHDYVASAQGLITEAIGEFVDSGVTSETSVGVAAFGDGGILGANEYSVQLNTNNKGTTSACAGHSGCTVWQQFVYATDYVWPSFNFLGISYPGVAGVFIEYWLNNWGNAACPAGWSPYVTPYESYCVLNSAVVSAPDVPIADLEDLELVATASAGGYDSVIFAYDSDVYAINTPDSVLDIASVWTQTEFNIVGDAGGSEAVFNSGSSITPYLFLKDGSSSPPACVDNAGTTGETNNLNLGTCSASVFWGFPYIYFTESN